MADNKIEIEVVAHAEKAVAPLQTVNAQLAALAPAAAKAANALNPLGTQAAFADAGLNKLNGTVKTVAVETTKVAAATVAATTATTGWGVSIGSLIGYFIGGTGVIAVIGAAVTAITFLVEKFGAAAQAQAKFAAAISSGDLGTLKGELADINDEIDKLIQRQTAASTGQNRSIIDTALSNLRSAGQFFSGGGFPGTQQQQQARDIELLDKEVEEHRKKQLALDEAIGNQISIRIDKTIDEATLSRQIAAEQNEYAKARLQVEKQLLDFKAAGGLKEDIELARTNMLAAAYAKVAIEQKKAAGAGAVGFAESRVDVEKARLLGAGGFGDLGALQDAQTAALKASSALAEQQAGASGNTALQAALKLTNANKALALAIQHTYEDEQQATAINKLHTDAVKDQVALIELQFKLQEEATNREASARARAGRATGDILAEAGIAGMPANTPQEQLAKQIAATQLQFAQRRRAIQDERDAIVSASQDTLDAYEKQIAAVTQLEDATVQAMRNSKDAVVQLNQALTDAFVQGFDRAYDALFDTTKNFGQRVTGLFAGIGESLVKALLHGMLTVPFQQALQQSGGPLSLIFGLLGKIPGLAGLFGAGIQELGIGLPVAAEAGTSALGFLGLFAEGGYVKGSPYPTPDWIRKLPPSVHRMAGGGRVTNGPTLAVIGEGGEDEYIVPKSKMKRKSAQAEQPLNIHLWDQRPRGLQKDDVLAVVSDDMLRNGITGKASVVVQSRNR